MYFMSPTMLNQFTNILLFFLVDIGTVVTLGYHTVEF